MKKTIKSLFAVAAFTVALLACTSKPAENTEAEVKEEEKVEEQVETPVDSTVQETQVDTTAAQ